MNSDIPDVLYIETTNTCNANCIFCAYQYDERPKNIIDFELFKKIVLRYKKVGGNQISLSPFAGEVFVDPNILVKINFLREQDFSLIYTYTNALLLHKFSMNNILTSGLTRLNISMAPLREDLYIKIYRNNSYKQLLKNISNLLIAFNNTIDKTLENISIEFRSNISLHEIKQLPDYKYYIEPYINKNIHIGCMQIFDSWMGKIKSNDLLDGMVIKDANFDKPVPCSRLSMLQVLANGDTRVCGCRYNHESKEDVFFLGNATSEDIIDMYMKPKVKELKDSFFRSEIPKECELCSWYTGDNKWVNMK